MNTGKIPRRTSSAQAAPASTYIVLGQAVRVTWAAGMGQEWRERLDILLVPYRSPGPAPANAFTVSVSGPTKDNVWTLTHDDTEERFLGEDELVRQLERLIAAEGARHSPIPLLLHAGAVVRDGSVLLLPAHSGWGKTTLTLALGARGWLPLTDDICPVETQGDDLFTGCNPRCVHLSDTSREVLRSQGIALQGPVAGLAGYYRPLHWGTPGRIHNIIFPRYVSGKKATLIPLTMAEIAAQLLPMRFERDSFPRETQWDAVIRLASRAPGWRLLYGELEEAFAVIDQVTQLKRAQA